jgi:hypothetical protein
MTGTIDRRLLINYRIDPRVLEAIVPSPFRPQLVDGVGIAGICLIRLGKLRPFGMPASFGVTTENAAHRIAVEWDGPGRPCRGVYIPRRDTSSLLTVLLGGRLFPGAHHRARFQVGETTERVEVAYRSLDGMVGVAASAKRVSDFGAGSVFNSLEEASSFFEGSPLGYSPTGHAGCFEGLELHTSAWHVEPLEVERVESSFFADTATFPPGSIELDSALLMHDIPVVWRAREDLQSRPIGIPTPARPMSEAPQCE